MNNEQTKAKWTPDKIETLKTLWAQGAGGSEIVTAFNGEFTRSAICGKISRLRAKQGFNAFEPRSNAGKRAKTPAAPVLRARKPYGPRKKPSPPPAIRTVQAPPLAPFVPRKPRPLPFEPPPPVEPLRVALLDLTSKSCRWPLWSAAGRLRFMPPEEIVFCGVDKEEPEKSQYCAYHRHLNRGEGTRSERDAARDGERAAV